MANPPLPLASSLKAVIDEARGALGPHPEIPVLAAYREGSLPENEAEAVREHLVLCPECSDKLLDLADFLEATPPLGDQPLPEAAVADAWERMKSRLPEVRPSPGGISRSRRFTRYALPLAACLLLSVTAVVVFYRQAGLSNPQRIYLDLDQDGTRGEETALSALASRPVQLLARQVPPGPTRVQARIFQVRDGKVVWTGDKQPRDAEETDLGTLRAGKLEPGVYRVEVYAQGRDEPLNSFPLHLH